MQLYTLKPNAAALLCQRWRRWHSSATALVSGLMYAAIAVLGIAG